uniref:Uncharacterized protein n=1 Tax=Rhizophora mucronata TaxID=61149 RepID=A0A2P2QHR3_RHIMU
MEIQEDKLWAHFIAEATAPITRVDIFLSLLDLLHQTGTGGMDSAK